MLCFGFLGATFPTLHAQQVQKRGQQDYNRVHERAVAAERQIAMLENEVERRIFEAQRAAGVLCLRPRLAALFF